MYIIIIIIIIFTYQNINVEMEEMPWRKTLYLFVFPDLSLGNKIQKKTHLFDTRIDFFFYGNRIATTSSF